MAAGVWIGSPRADNIINSKTEARFIDMSDTPEQANCALVMETEFDYNNMCVYLIKDVDTTEGPVMPYLDYRESFHLLEQSDIDICRHIDNLIKFTTAHCMFVSYQVKINIAKRELK
eukprot:gene10386-12282_t